MLKKQAILELNSAIKPGLKQLSAIFYLLLWVSPATADEKFADRLFHAFQNKQATPQISLVMPQLSEGDAYRIQQNYVKLRQQNDPISGFKAGLTSTAGQQKFNVSQSLSGALFNSGHLANGQTLSLKDSGKLMLETEIGFILSKPINRPIENLQQLHDSIDSIAAVIELPDLGYVEPTKLTGTDLIASNVASHRYIVGGKKKLQSVNNVNQLTTRLIHNNNQVFEGKATDALGDQWLALQWLINQLVQQGYELSAGNLLITGALGKMVAANPGDYVAEFGTLGQITFKVSQ